MRQALCRRYGPSAPVALTRMAILAVCAAGFSMAYAGDPLTDSATAIAQSSPWAVVALVGWRLAASFDRLVALGEQLLRVIDRTLDATRDGRPVVRITHEHRRSVVRPRRDDDTD